MVQELDDAIFDIDRRMCLDDKEEYGLNKILNVAYKGSNSDRSKFTANLKLELDSMEEIKEEDFVNALLDNTKKEGDLAEGIADTDKRKDFDDQYLGELSGFKSKLVKNLPNNVLPNYSSYRNFWNILKDKWKPIFENINKIESKEEREKQKKIQQALLDAEAVKRLRQMAPMNIDQKIYQILGGLSIITNGAV